MTTNDIKKALYIQKPLADYSHTQDGCKIYSCEIVIDDVEEIIEFKVPFDDGAITMEDSLPAQLLIRWLKND